MEPPLRGFDRLLYAILLAGFLWATFARTPEPSPVPGSNPSTSGEFPVEIEGGSALPDPSLFDERVLVDVEDRQGPGSGSAFAIAKGVWMTAHHVVRNCPRVGLITGPGQAIRAEVVPEERADAAVLRARFSATALPIIDDASSLRLGQSAYHVGYPQGRPGQVSSRLLGRQTLITRGAVRRREPILAWAETARSQGIWGSLGGLSGGPAISSSGEVIGVTIAEAPRRGRIYTTAPRTTAQLVSQFAARDATAMPIDAGRFSESADALRRSQQVAMVICAP